MRVYLRLNLDPIKVGNMIRPDTENETASNVHEVTGQCKERFVLAS